MRCFADADCAAPQTCDKDLTRYDKTRALCEKFFASAWARHTETASRKGDPCPALPTYEDAKANAEAQASVVASAMTGAGFTTPCGNGVVDSAAESCDGSDLNGESCSSLGYAAGSGLGCTTECRFDLSGCEAWSVPSRFRDNGDGTATDIVSRLQWELKDGLGGGADAGNLHDADNVYSWSTASSNDFEGTVATVFLAG